MHAKVANYMAKGVKARFHLISLLNHLGFLLITDTDHSTTNNFDNKNNYQDLLKQ